MNKSVPGVFVTSKTSVNGCSGGQQICTAEYQKALVAAGFELTLTLFDWDRRLLTRLRRRLRNRPYKYLLPAGLAETVLSKVRQTGARFIFLNVVDVAPLAAELKPQLPSDSQIVLLSHGLGSVDYLHIARTRDLLDFAGAAELLGRHLLAEVKQRRNIDCVFCPSPFEVEIERWLGSKRIEWLPRIIDQKEALQWKPSGKRLGCVSTLDHPPNREGIERLLGQFEVKANQPFCFRIVGGPEAVGREIALKYRHAEYVGPLDDLALKEEASTWNAFVHPLFCYARGCSTKLAIGLSWRIPVVTTPQGARGYTWREGNLPMASSPEALAELALGLLDTESAGTAQVEVERIANTMPSLGEVARRISNVLLRNESAFTGTQR